ncbi:MAG: hypothetical protein LWX51_00995, partial [Deltaproteobacteria bacterium]|nr:hypothetical protein [Deltaproteobacteria bacterium]
MTGKLRTRLFYSILLGWLVFWSFNALDAFADVIVDNGDPGTSYTGTWKVSGGSNPYGVDSLWARDGATYTWQFDSQASGTYEVLMWWSEWPSRGTDISVDINYRDGIETRSINQLENAGLWNSFGTYYFDVSGSVTITAANGSTVSTCADAVWFKLISANTPPTASIDSITPNPAEPDQPVQFKGQGTDAEGSVEAYQWESSIDGWLSNLSSFTTSSLTEGTHTISFKVQDDEGIWSEAVTQDLVVGAIPTEIIIDNGAPSTSYTGTWKVSGGSNPYGADSLYSRDGATYTWTFAPTVSGYYKVSMWWTEWPSRSTSVPVDFEHSEGTTRVDITQRQNGGQWNMLDDYHDYYFESGSSYNVTITAQPGPSSTCADAVRFVFPGEANSQPVATNVAITGAAKVGQTLNGAYSYFDDDGDL